MDRFIEVTYDRYQEAVGDEFDLAILAIFTDEPRFIHKGCLKYATRKTDVFLSWIDDLEETFSEAYKGESLLAGEKYWQNVSKILISRTVYLY